MGRASVLAACGGSQAGRVPDVVDVECKQEGHEHCDIANAMTHNAEPEHFMVVPAPSYIVLKL